MALGVVMFEGMLVVVERFLVVVIARWVMMFEIGLTFCKMVFFRARLLVFSRLWYAIRSAVMMQMKMETGYLIERNLRLLIPGYSNLIDGCGRLKKLEDVGRTRRKNITYLS